STGNGGPTTSPANGSGASGSWSNGAYRGEHRLTDPNVTDLLGALYRQRWRVAAALLAAALAGYGIGWRSPAETRAGLRLLLVERSDEGLVTAPSDPLPLPERQSALVSRVESQRTRTDAIEALGLGPGDITSVSAEAEEGESFVTIEVTTSEGVDPAAVTNEVAESVVAQQRNAVRERFEALAAELQASAAQIDPEIQAIDARLQQLAQEMAQLQLTVDRATGTDASVDPQVNLTLRNDEATGLRSTRTALLSTKSDSERQDREANVAAA